MANSHLRFNDSDDEVLDLDMQNDETENVYAAYERSSDEEEVFGIDSNEGDSEIALSDLEDKNDEDLPDVRAWGKEKKKYYSTDYVDADYSTIQGKDAFLADLEEEEAKKLQTQLMEQLQDTDFDFELIRKKTTEDTKNIEEVVKVDISKLSKRQKIEILSTEAPEFFGLVDDCKKKMKLLQLYLFPLKNSLKRNSASENMCQRFIQNYLQIILNYTVNISMYLFLKSQKASIKFHPIVKRLFQYRQLMEQMENVFDKVIKPQMDAILQETPIKGIIEKFGAEYKVKLKEKLCTASDNLTATIATSIQGHNDLDDYRESEFEKEDKNQDAGEKRLITYQIAKNKGLLPHRKKEQRNPRVKNKLRYRKAKIRRKGAIREVRKELSKYQGEASGIKIAVKKSITLK